MANTDTRGSGGEPNTAAASWPGQTLNDVGRRMLMLCFLVLFLLIAHQKFFTGYVRSQEKLILLMGLMPFVVTGGVCSVIGWWRMRRAGAFAHPGVKEEAEERRHRRRRHREEAELLPWQRGR